MKVKGCLLLALGAVVGLVTVIVFVVVLVKGIGETQKGAISLDTAGAHAVRFEPGEYTVFLEAESEEGGSVDLSRLRVYGPEEGKTLSVERSAGGRYSLNGRHGRGVARFPVSQGGDYRVEIGFEPGGNKIVLIRDFTGSVMKTVGGSLAIIFGGLFLGLMLLAGGIVLLVRGNRAAAVRP